MPRKATGGSWQNASGRWYARVTFGGRRRALALPEGFTAPAAEARTEVLAALATRLGAALTAGRVPEDIALGLLERAAAGEGQRLADVLGVAEKILSGSVPVTRSLGRDATFKDIGDRWTSGELARLYPDHVKAKRRTASDETYMRRYLNPEIGPVPVIAFTLDHAQCVMAALPSKLGQSTRRAVALCMSRVLSIAVFPLRIIAAHPLPKGFVPSVGKRKVRGWIYPDEERTVLGCVKVPICWRVAYGFLVREGLRYNEAAALDLGDIDRARGTVNLDRNKTDDPRTWALGSDVTTAFAAWIAYRERRLGRRLRADEPLLVNVKGTRLTASDADRFRAHLLRAGVSRDDLHEKSGDRRPMRVHDLRASFITLALAMGRSETWVQDRTGHRSSTQINGYRRRARLAVELALGWLAPMDEAIPELRTGAAPERERESAQAPSSCQDGSTWPPGSQRKHGLTATFPTTARRTAGSAGSCDGSRSDPTRQPDAVPFPVPVDVDLAAVGALRASGHAIAVEALAWDLFDLDLLDEADRLALASSRGGGGICSAPTGADAPIDAAPAARTETTKR